MKSGRSVKDNISVKGDAPMNGDGRVKGNGQELMSAQLLDVALQVVGWAERGEEIEAFVVHERETNVRAYKGDVESLTSASSQGIGVRVVRDGQQGLSYATVLEDDVLLRALTEARDNCSFASSDEFAGVASPDGLEPVKLDLYRSSLASFSVDKKVAMALELERATLAADSRVTGIEAAEYVDSTVSSAIATSAGVAAESNETGCYLAAYSLAEDKGETQTGFGFSVGRHPDELSVDIAAKDSAERATRLLGATKPKSACLSVVLDPYVTAQLISVVGATLSGEAVLKGRSMFADRVGADVASSLFTLIDDATDPQAFSASAIDDEGLATRKVPLIVNGVLQGFLYDTYTARRANVSSTGSASRSGFASAPGVAAQALRLKPGTRMQPEIIADIEDGLLVQGVVGLHSGVNPVSGDFSVGAEGVRIRNGTTAEPVREITIASTLQRLLQNVVEVGGDVTWLPMSATGVSLAVSDVVMSGL